MAKNRSRRERARGEATTNGSQATGPTIPPGSERSTKTLIDFMWDEMESLSRGELSIPLANATSRKQMNLINAKKLELMGNGDEPEPLPL